MRSGKKSHIEDVNVVNFLPVLMDEYFHYHGSLTTGNFYNFCKLTKNLLIIIILLCFVEMCYLNTIEQLFLFIEQLDQLEVCLPYSRLLTGIPILAVFQNLGWNSNKTSLL